MNLPSDGNLATYAHATVRRPETLGMSVLLIASRSLKLHRGYTESPCEHNTPLG